MKNASVAHAIREAVGIFSRGDDLQGAIDDLLSAGFDRAQLSLLASASAVERHLGHRFKRVGPLEDDPTVPRTAYVSTEAVGDAKGAIIGALVYVGATAAAGAVVASGGALAMAIAAATVAGGVGGLVGSILAKRVGDHHASYLQQQIDRGGLLLWVRAWDTEGEKRAVAILKKHSGRDVHVHGRVQPAHVARHGRGTPIGSRRQVRGDEATGR